MADVPKVVMSRNRMSYWSFGRPEASHQRSSWTDAQNSVWGPGERPTVPETGPLHTVELVVPMRQVRIRESLGLKKNMT
jgi:hypothetical protein